MDSNPRRRWLRFSLKGLLIVVTLLSLAGGYVLHEWRIVQDRLAVLTAFNRHFVPIVLIDGNELKGPRHWIRRAMGDKKAHFVFFAPTLSESSLKRFREAYPEAVIESDLERIRSMHPFSPELYEFLRSYKPDPPQAAVP